MFAVKKCPCDAINTALEASVSKILCKVRVYSWLLGAGRRRYLRVTRAESQTARWLKLLMALSAVLLLASSCSREKRQTELLRGETMGTTYSIKVVLEPNNKLPENLAGEIDSTLVSFNQIMSTYIADSELSKINLAPEKGWLTVSTPLYHILDMSKQISAATRGAFDVTVGPLVNLWGFGPVPASDSTPQEQELIAAQARVGDHLFTLDADRRAIHKQADIYIDLSAIAKGYAVDLVVGLLAHHGLVNFMVEIGGEIFLRGTNGEGKPWRIGVEKPSLAHKGAVHAIALSNVGVATSGDYRNYREVAGQRYSHTIDPVSGQPITHKLASVTVIATTAAEADALATAINVMGPQKGLEFAEKNKLAVYLLIRQEDAFVSQSSKAFEPYLEAL